MKKIVIGGLLVGALFWVVGMIFGTFTADLYAMSPKVFWKPMTGTWAIKMVAYNFVSAFIFAHVFSMIGSVVPGKGYQKGLVFGLLIFLVGPFLGLSMTYITMAIRAKLVFMWALNNLVAYLLAGITFQLIEERIQ
ncbi:hypothetical protein ACFLZ2_01765 [Candidatus Margulisiibacteriota bacterium]